MTSLIFGQFQKYSILTEIGLFFGNFLETLWSVLEEKMDFIFHRWVKKHFEKIIEKKLLEIFL